jgi:hypothetical protein
MFGALADHTRRDIVRRAIKAEEGIIELASHLPDELRSGPEAHRHPRSRRLYVLLCTNGGRAVKSRSQRY